MGLERANDAKRARTQERYASKTCFALLCNDDDAGGRSISSNRAAAECGPAAKDVARARILRGEPPAAVRCRLARCDAGSPYDHGMTVIEPLQCKLKRSGLI